MKHYHSVILFLLLFIPSVFMGINNYKHAERAIISDMNQALALTLAEQNVGVITPDTIKSYRNNLKINELKNLSYVYYASDDNRRKLSSDRMRWRNNSDYEFQSYADCSFATVYSMSNQSLPLLMFLSAIIWSIYSVFYFRRHKEEQFLFGNIIFSDGRFYDFDKEPLHFTPMQFQLMEMLWNAEEHILSKEVICNALWPKKPDANETLYTLVRRLRPVLEDNSSLRITADRNGNYMLTETEQ